ncbi:MAG: hypothetical protein J1G07_01040 [Clostridiales bacterium]|nr:hypothetical protein [Clostridiales bacterium]
MEDNEKKEEKVNIRHTISAEETFTLAKDLFDIRCFVKNVYSNRAVISRRMNVLTLAFSAIFTILYAAYVLFTALYKKLSFGLSITLYVLLGVYAVLFIALLILFICGGSDTKHVLRTKRTLKVFKFLVRLLSIAISIIAIVFSTVGGEYAASHVALDIIIIVFSIIMLIVQIIPLLFGGIGQLARWLISPVKTKYRFSHVILEWYDLAVSGSIIKGSKHKVSSKYFEDIGTIIDNYLIPALGKKYISTIKPVTILSVVDRAEESIKPVMEGVLKNVFAYAVECGYVVFDPCKDLNFSGSVEEEEKKQKTTFKEKLFGVGKKIGKNMLEKYINDNSGNNE